MSVKYVTVQWTKRKLVYDLFIVAGVAIYVLLFKQLTGRFHTGREVLTGNIVDMRAWGTCAFLMLTLILMIGPLARIDRRFAPWLYNRRHLGVAMFFVALMHARAVLGYYYNYTGDLPQLVAFLVTDNRFTPASAPFPIFGGIALAYLAVMAVSSHDFWQKTLGPSFWKWLHMGVYGVYALVVAHVAFGALQSENHPVFVTMVVGSVAIVGLLHVLAALRSRDTETTWVDLDGERWVDAGTPDSIPEGRAKPVCVPGHERIALIRWEGKVSALHGVCAHQGGPLYEGKVLFGALTCPWHGWQYKPEDGKSPPPFTEELPTYRVRLHEGHVLVLPKPLDTASEPVVFDVAADELARKSKEAQDG